MNLEWNLDALYLDFNNNYKKDIEKLKELINEYTAFAESKRLNNDENIKDILLEYIDFNEKISILSSKLYAFPALINSTNSKDVTAEKYMSILENILSQLTVPHVRFKKWIQSVNDLDKICHSNRKLREHLFLFKELKKEAQYTLNDNEEKIIAKLQLTGGESWSKLQGRLTSNLMIDIIIDNKKEKMPLSEVRNLAYHDNPCVRKHAYEQELSAYSKIEDAVAMSLCNIKRETNYINTFRGFKKPLEETLMNSRLKEKTLEVMMHVIEEYLPYFRQYLRKKAEYLGHKKGLPFYDLFAPVGASNKTYTYEEAQEIIIENYASFSNSLSEFAKKAFSNHWIDVKPREGKRGGAFCKNLPFINESRILTNFTGSLSNISTLAHELGHGYHGAIIAEESPLHWNYPMPLAETASILCETIVMNNMLKSLTDSDALHVLEMSLMGSTQVIVDIFSRFTFETELFEKTQESNLSSDQLKNMMLKAQKTAYGDGLDYKYLHPYMWINKPHYYSPNLHFYNFPYAFGLLYAKGLYAQYLNDKDIFVEKYDLMLKETGKNSIENVAALMGINITNEDFWRNSLDMIKEEIEQFLSLINHT